MLRANSPTVVASRLRPSNSTKNGHTVHKLQHNLKTTIANDKSRPWRILLFALFFVLTALRRMHVTIANFDFLSSLLSEEDESSSSQQSSDSSILRYALAKDASLIIFYNLYIPNDEEGIKNAINVVKDQIGQIASVLTRIEKENKSTKNQSRGVVLYNLIGNEHAYSTTDMKSLCHKLHPRLDCQLLEFHKEASEAVTLQDIHDYCHSGISYNQNATRVTYLHSKGSYHSQDTPPTPPLHLE